MSQELKYWLAAAHASSITPRHFLQWLEVISSPEALFRADEITWRELGMNQTQIQAFRQPDWKAVEESIAWAARPNCHILTLGDSHYPQLLKEISDPPLVLFVQGEAALVSSWQIGMVGARNVSPYGQKNAYQFAYQLSAAGFVITSGLARGVDAACHRGALASRGPTIAVAGTGLLHTYPQSHKELASEIVTKGGALVSEFPLSTGPRSYHFPRRNRIISGLSQGVVVVEAQLRSGSLVSARHAVEQGREVFAIPGAIQSPGARGCHALIRQGAKLVESAEDILEEFSAIQTRLQVEFFPPLAIIPDCLTGIDQKVYEQIGSTVTSLDEIILRSGLTASAVSSILLSLELQGHIQSITGGYVR